jgi:hypothetical protein
MVTLGAALMSAKPGATTERERRNEYIFEKNDFDFWESRETGGKADIQTAWHLFL